MISKLFGGVAAVAFLVACASAPVTDKATSTISPKLEGAITLLRGYCIATKAEVSTIAEMVLRNNGIEYSEAATAEAEVFGEGGGRAFGVVYGGERYAILVSGPGSCGVEVENETVADAGDLVQRTFAVGAPRGGLSARGEIRNYAFTAASPHHGGHILVLAPANMPSTARFVRVAFVPHWVARR